jgi:hypothetical protein
MATNAQLAAKLLRGAAGFFRTVGDQNEPIKAQMEQNARTYEHVATLVEQDPSAEMPFPQGDGPQGEEKE